MNGWLGIIGILGDWLELILACTAVALAIEAAILFFG
jgi:hypothetical protein